MLAVDQDAAALSVHAANSPAPVAGWNLCARGLVFPDADLWWLSPPCQPFTARGRGRDLDDPRAAPLLRVLDRIAERRPRCVALENVPAFAASRAAARVRQVLDAAGYARRERLLCPTSLGVPNRRLRYYLLASIDPLPPWREVPPIPPVPIRAFLDPAPDPDPALRVDLSLPRRYPHALSIVDPGDRDSACFTAAYGHSPVRAGSYLRDRRGLRRFSPSEIARLLGFPEGFVFPADLPTRRRWGLLGDSLPVVAVREVLGPVTDSLGSRT